METMIELGLRYRDTATELVGTATALADYLAGPRMALLEFLDRNGRLCEEWVHVGRLVEVS